MSSSANYSLYGYIPSTFACYAFVILYAVSTITHSVQAFKSSAWWIFPTVVVAGVAEAAGWVARLASSHDPSSLTPFIIQTTVLVLAPTPFVAALFIGFGRISARVGPQFSRLSPAMYSKVFLTCDILSLIIQGAGGGISAASTTNPDAVRTGSNVILVGLFIQIAAMTVFCVFMAEYAWRRVNNRPFRKFVDEESENLPMDRHMKRLVFGICLSTLFVYIRAVYRVIEFADGFSGKIAHTQILFNFFDGVMITLAMYTLNVFNPGYLLQTSPQGGGYFMTGIKSV